MPRLTFKYIQAQAKAFGVIVERGTGREITYYHESDHSVQGVAFSVADAWGDLVANFMKI